MTDTTLAWLAETKQRILDERSLAAESGAASVTLTVIDGWIAALDDAMARLSPKSRIGIEHRARLDQLQLVLQDAADKYRNVMPSDSELAFIVQNSLVWIEAMKAFRDYVGYVEAQTWQSIETLLDVQAEALFWIVPKTAEETYVDTSGQPVLATAKPYVTKAYFGGWPSLLKATHWMPLPAPPVGGPATQLQPTKEQ